MTATGVPGFDHPEERAVVELLLADRGEVLISWVERVEDEEVVVTAGRDRAQRSVRLDPGDRVEVVWKDTSELRSLPTRFDAAAGSGGETVWHLTPTGPAVRGQRRAAVRAPIPLEVVATRGRTTLAGTTVDISEGGFRAVFRPEVLPDAPGVVPKAPSAADAPSGDPAPAAGFEAGEVLDVVVDLEPGDQFRAQAEVTRDHQRQDENIEVSVRFIGLHEKAQDVVRARVFAGLRELRQRGLL